MKLNKTTILTILLTLTITQFACSVSSSITPTPSPIIPTQTSTPLPRPTETEIIAVPIHPTITENYKENHAVVVNCNYLNVRTNPDDTSQIIISIPVKSKVQILSSPVNNWYFIKYENVYGYVYGNYIEIDHQ